MPKHYKDMIDELINKMDEDAPANAVAHGDNNNVVLRGINETLNKLEDKIDEKSGIKKEEVKIVEKKKTFHDKFVKDLMNNTPHSGQFDEDL